MVYPSYLMLTDSILGNLNTWIDCFRVRVRGRILGNPVETKKAFGQVLHLKYVPSLTPGWPIMYQIQLHGPIQSTDQRHHWRDSRNTSHFQRW